MEYLAFDFGDGTTTAAHYDDSWGVREPEVLNIVKGDPEVWSYMSFPPTTDGPVLFGKSTKKGYTIKGNWKSKPSAMDSQNRSLTVQFMRGIFDRFVQNNPEYSKDGRFRGGEYTIAIGIPSDWDAEDAAEYKKIAAEAGLPNVDVFKESQAAVLFARKFMNGGIPDDAIKHGVLLVDIGSSTTDFTYMKDLACDHCGLALGAKYIDQALLFDATQRAGYEYDTPDADAETKAQAEKARKRDLLETRKFKEAFFSAADLDDNPEIETFPLPACGQRLGYEGYLTKGAVDSCLDGSQSVCVFKLKLKQLSQEWHGTPLEDRENTWRGHFREALKHVKGKWRLGPKTTIVVTGGATRMQFVKTDIQSVFGDRVEPYFGNDGQRSFSVVKGLAWASYAKRSIDSTRSKLEDLLHSGKCKKAIETYAEKLLHPYAERISEAVRKNLCPRLRSRDQSVSTKRLLEAEYSKLMTKGLNDFLKETNNGIDVSDLLEVPEVSEITAGLQALFSRPSIELDHSISASFPWRYVGMEFNFDPWEEALWNYPTSDDESFNGVWGLGTMFDNAASGIEKSCNAHRVMGIFKTRFPDPRGGEIDSDFEKIVQDLTDKIKAFKSQELDVIEGLTALNARE